MKNLIEYLLLFLIVILFNSNSLFNIIFIVCSMIIYFTYLIIYFVKNKNRERSKVIPNMDFFISGVMLICLNLVQVFDFTNIIFGIILNIFLLIYIIKSLIRKDYSFNDHIFETKHIFEIYIIIYLINLLINLLVYQI